MGKNESMTETTSTSKSCKHRRRETRNGVTMDWCYAIGFEELGDLVCEYCNERKGEKKENKKSGEGKKI